MMFRGALIFFSMMSKVPHSKPKVGYNRSWSRLKVMKFRNSLIWELHSLEPGSFLFEFLSPLTEAGRQK